jgi:hypothetical protein
MKKFAFAVLTVCAMASTGCGSPCDDLKTTCDACPSTAAGAIYKSACEAVVSAGVDEACDLAKSSYSATCGGSDTSAE